MNSEVILSIAHNCDWEPHPLYSVFTQFDCEFYNKYKDIFLFKYKVFYAVAKFCKPEIITELGTSAGSGMDAYMCASEEQTKYYGYDAFSPARHNNGLDWPPYEIALMLAKDRKYLERVWLIRTNLRWVNRIIPADFLVVDAAHDYYNEYNDLHLAFDVKPKWIWVDDAEDINNAKPAIERFEFEIKDNIEWAESIPYNTMDGGRLIKLKYD